jgi:hypothetical protein
MNSLTALLCLFDDFCQGFEPEWEKRLLMDGRKKRRPASLSLSELMTLAVLFLKFCENGNKRITDAGWIAVRCIR